MFRKAYLLLGAIPKTLYFNFKYLPFKRAIKLPILVSHRVWLMNTQGKVYIESEEISPFMIKLGFNEVGIFDQMRERSVWNVSGKVIFRGKALIGHGSKISVDGTGQLDLGKDLIITAESAIVCRKKITLQDEVMISWETQIMDSDLHPIIDGQGKRINEDEPIEIGKKSWLGCRCLILKGVTLKPGTIVAAGTTLSKSVNYIEKPNTLIGGNPIKVLKEDVEFKI